MEKEEKKKQEEEENPEVKKTIDLLRANTIVEAKKLEKEEIV